MGGANLRKKLGDNGQRRIHYPDGAVGGTNKKTDDIGQRRIQVVPWVG